MKLTTTLKKLLKILDSFLKKRNGGIRFSFKHIEEWQDLEKKEKGSRRKK